MQIAGNESSTAAFQLPTSTDAVVPPEAQVSDFLCVRCREAGLVEAVHEFFCPACHSKFPVVFGVPLLVERFDIQSAEHQIETETLERICNQLGLSVSSELLGQLGQILGKNYLIGDLAQTAENNYLLNRLAVAEAETRCPVSDATPEIPVNKAVRYRIDFHYIPNQLPAGKQVSYNVRFTNCGDSIISSVDAPPIFLSYQFINSAGKAIEGRRTKLPIRLLPGRSLTVPIVIQTPTKRGDYQLAIQLVHETVARLHQDAVQHSVQVTREENRGVWQTWNHTGINHGGYDPDHTFGRKILADRIAQQDSPRILEIGGCCNPMMRGLCEDLHSIDIDMQTLQVGQLLATQNNDLVQYVCADGSNLPYREESFDWIVMFSTLHHFADPGQVLGDLKRFLKPTGRIATMCEPIGHYIDGNVYAKFIEELEQGINEQTFSLEEYQAMIDRAGLQVDEVIVDVGSLKLILKR